MFFLVPQTTLSQFERIIDKHHIQVRALQQCRKREEHSQGSTKEAQRNRQKMLFVLVGCIYFHSSGRKRLYWHTNVCLYDQWIMGNITVDCMHLLLLPLLSWHRNIFITCINAKVDALGWMDLWAVLCVLKVIYHGPYPTCQICWTCCLLFKAFSNGAEGVFMIQNPKELDWMNQAFSFLFYMQMLVFSQSFPGSITLERYSNVIKCLDFHK